MKQIFLIAVLVVIGFVLFFLNSHYRTIEVTYVTVEMPSGDELVLKRAVTHDEVVRGLSHVSEMVDYDGMLFVFDQPMTVNFWMNDMTFSLDLIYLDENRVVQEIHHDKLPCLSGELDNCEKYKSVTGNIKYVVEIPAGMSDNYQIEISKEIKW